MLALRKMRKSKKLSSRKARRNAIKKRTGIKSRICRNTMTGVETKKRGDCNYKTGKGTFKMRRKDRVTIEIVSKKLVNFAFGENNNKSHFLDYDEYHNFHKKKR